MNIARLFRRANLRLSPADALYSAVVEKSRDAAFYASFGVPDTVDGRFDMIVIHTMLVFRRLRDGGSNADNTGQMLFDWMFKDMDRSLREMGVGDLGVARHIKKMAKAFYGRAAEYEKGLDGDPAVLAQSLETNVFRQGTPSPAALVSMADYLHRAASFLGQQSVADIVAGCVRFPETVTKRTMAPIHPSTPECSYPIEVVSLPSEGRSNDLAAILEEREAVAARLGLQELSSLTASLLVARTSGAFIAVTGYFEAEVVQTCVVTLVPVRSTVRENISAMFMEDGSTSADKKHSGAEELISIEEDDPPELVKEGLIDLGELVVEQLALALDPYPRAPGVNFGAVTWGSDEVGETPFGDKPFAVLGKLKNIKPS